MKKKQEHAQVKLFPPELAPCGVYCGACPSFGKTCHGCPSDRSQKRKSKWGCKLRKCCYTEKALAYCFECDEFPCKTYRQKLTEAHPGDPRFDYRHELIESCSLFSELGLEGYLQYQDEKWRCSQCAGRVHWYRYKCSRCGTSSEK